MAKYPKIGKTYETHMGGICKVCGKPNANYRVVVEISHMRGDDEVYKVHLICITQKTDSELLEMLMKDTPTNPA